MFNIFACGNCTPDNKDVRPGFECVFYYVHPNAPGSCDKKFPSCRFLDRSNVSPGIRN
jgi:hypothetical protein